MSDYDDDYDDDDYEEATAPVFTEEAPAPPAEMKLSVEVGLSEYSPKGLLDLIARALLVEIGGRDRWKERLESYLLHLGKQKAEALCSEVVSRIFAEGAAGLDFTAIVRKAAEEWAVEKVDSSGNRTSYGGTLKTRMEWMVGRVVKEGMDNAFKAAETEWKRQTTDAIKLTLHDALAQRLSKAFPVPPELKG